VSSDSASRCAEGGQRLSLVGNATSSASIRCSFYRNGDLNEIISGRIMGFFIGFLLILVLANVEEAMGEDWKLFTSDKKFHYYLDATNKIHAGKGVFEVKVKGVSIDKEKFLKDVKTLGKPVENYKNYNHTVFEATVDCPNKGYFIKLITEYDDKGKVIDYVASALMNWLPVSKGTLGEILYQAECH